MTKVDDDPAVATEATPAPAPVVTEKPKRTRKAKAVAEPEPAPKGRPKAKAKARVAVKGTTKAKAPMKTAKPKRHRDPNKLDEFGYRKGSTRSKAAHLYAGKKGATLAEVKTKLGTGTQYNVLTELQGRGFKVRRATEKNRAGREITRFYVEAAR